MKISGKIHRGASIAAAVVMLLFLIVGTGTNIISTINLSKYYETPQLLRSVLNLAANTIASLMLIVVLFRGKKDSVSGILVILTILIIPVRGVVAGVTRIITGFGMLGSMTKGLVVCLIASSVIQIVANLAGVGFRALIATECFKPGKITGGKTKAFLVILPIVNILLIAVSNMVQQLYLVADYGVTQFLIVVLMPAALTVVMSLGTVLMGVAFSIPVYETNIFDHI